MNAKELAALLNGREYRHEITKDECEKAKQHGLVVVFGASDDLMEFRGAIDDEMGLYDGGTAYVDSVGLIPDRLDVDDDDDESLKSYFARMESGQRIEAEWCGQQGYLWAYSTEIEHETFDIMRDREKYCRGMVFSLSGIEKNASESVDSGASLGKR